MLFIILLGSQMLKIVICGTTDDTENEITILKMTDTEQTPVNVTLSDKEEIYERQTAFSNIDPLLIRCGVGSSIFFLFCCFVMMILILISFGLKWSLYLAIAIIYIICALIFPYILHFVV